MLLLVALLVATVACAPLVALPLVVAAPPAAAVRRRVVPCPAQPLALAALVPFRAPPV